MVSQSCRGEPRFVCEIEVAVRPHDRRVLRARMEAARQLYNAVLGELLRRLGAAWRDPAWAVAKALPSGPQRAAAFAELRVLYGLSEYAAHKHPSLNRDCWIRGHLDANTAQKTATGAWRAVEQHMYGKRRRPRFRRRGELRSVEGKKPDVGIRLLDWGGDGPAVAWDGGHAKLRLRLLLDEYDSLHRAAVAAPVRYLRIVRREIRDRERFFCQVVCAGQPPVKHPARAGGRFGIDMGPSWVAVADPAGNADCYMLARGASVKARERRRYQRMLDRQRRANNPDCYDGDGRAVRGRRARRRSERMRVTERELNETQRKLAATRRNEHGRLINELLAEHGPVVHAEKISYRSFQRSYGRSVRDRAPGMFVAELARKAGQQGGAIVEVPTRTTFLSQRCLCGAKQRKALSERKHRCGCEHVPKGTHVDRDQLAAFLALFCDERGNFDQHAACAAWQGGANDRLLRTEMVREPAAKPQAPAHRRATRKGQSGSTGKRQRTPVTPPHAQRADGKPRGHRRTTPLRTGPKPPSFSRGDH